MIELILQRKQTIIKLDFKNMKGCPKKETYKVSVIFFFFGVLLLFTVFLAYKNIYSENNMFCNEVKHGIKK